ncbi:hypothetical protein DFH28DRAFT_1118154 [Melampsora americana]|nr:hypothetical protein DFH28DRAFT_1118154 [Melampsora americana]
MPLPDEVVHIKDSIQGLMKTFPNNLSTIPFSMPTHKFPVGGKLEPEDLPEIETKDEPAKVEEVEEVKDQPEKPSVTEDMKEESIQPLLIKIKRSSLTGT